MIWDRAKMLSDQGRPFVEVTLVAIRGSAPQDLGARMLVTPEGLEGLEGGTVGGGKIEARCIEYAQNLLRRFPEPSPPELLTWNLQRDIGMSCGGEVSVFFQVHRRDSWNIIVFGAGHVAQALARVLEPLHCQVTFVDPRPEWIEQLPSSPKIRRICHADPPAFVGEAPNESFFVVSTRGHASDVPVLLEIARRHPNAVYVGAIGSDVKALKIRKDLQAGGVSEKFISELHCPIGLKLGGNDPAEIAISIVAELLQARDQQMARNHLANARAAQKVEARPAQQEGSE